MPRSATAGGSDQPPEPWRSFLKALDERLEGTVDAHCIGGFAVTMQFGISRATSDIDVLTAVPNQELANLQRVGGQGSDLHKRFKLYLQPVTVACYPEDYEQRLIRMWPRFKLAHLRLYALESHDLALTKLERNSDVDRQDILALAKAGLIVVETIRDRYEKEFRPNLVSNVEKHDLTLELWTEMCWPPDRHSA
ncbi:MAG: DUF6036 family nucleotidyltransferase [Thermoanaerobaculia bacterium]